MNKAATLRSAEVRRHNGQCPYGDWMPLDEQDHDVQENVFDEILESNCRDMRREEHENKYDYGKIMIGGQIWMYRQI